MGFSLALKAEYEQSGNVWKTWIKISLCNIKENSQRAKNIVDSNITITITVCYRTCQSKYFDWWALRRKLSLPQPPFCGTSCPSEVRKAPNSLAFCKGAKTWFYGLVERGTEDQATVGLASLLRVSLCL